MDASLTGQLGQVITERRLGVITRDNKVTRHTVKASVEVVFAGQSMIHHNAMTCCTRASWLRVLVTFKLLAKEMTSCSFT